MKSKTDFKTPQFLLAILAVALIVGVPGYLLTRARESRRAAAIEYRQSIRPQPSAADLAVYGVIITLDDGAKVGIGGSLNYLLDDNGHVLTGGYHSIVPKDDGYLAKLGSTTYRLDHRGRCLSETNAVGKTVTYEQ